MTLDTTSEANNISGTAIIAKNVILGKNVSVADYVVFLESEADAAGSLTTVSDDVIIGPNSVIYSGVTLGAGSRIRAGSVVSRTIPPAAIVEGNPASIIGYVNALPDDRKVAGLEFKSSSGGTHLTSVRGVVVHRFPVINDMRGTLTVGEFTNQIPFTPLRYFMVYGVPNREVRGEHAHIACHQFLICVRGSCAVVADDGASRVEIYLDSPNTGVYLPPMIWGIQYKYSQDAILLVFASHHYDANDYIRNYDQFKLLCEKK